MLLELEVAGAKAQAKAGTCSGHMSKKTSKTKTCLVPVSGVQQRSDMSAHGGGLGFGVEQTSGPRLAFCAEVSLLRSRHCVRSFCSSKRQPLSALAKPRCCHAARFMQLY